MATVCTMAREAEAEPESDAYYGYGYGLGGYYGGAAHAVAPVVITYAAAPVVSHAVAPVSVFHAVHAVAPVVSSYAQVSPSASLSTVGIAPAAIPAVGGAY